MNLFKALGFLLLITSILIFLFTYEKGDINAGPLFMLGNFWVPLLCFIAGIVLIVKGLTFTPPTVKSGGSNRTASKSKKKKKK